MLFLIGLGLGNKDLSALALEEIKEADALFLESYTAFIPKEYADFIERQAGRKPTPLVRKDLEDGLAKTVAAAKGAKVVILVPGDPLIATTHGIILNEAKRQGIECRVIHAPSVFSIAIGESGLDVYKFGPTVTIPFWSERYRPTAFIDAIERNLRNGQHTLVLLDIEHKSFRPMKIEEAAGIISKATSGMKGAQLNSEKEIMILANLGRDDKMIVRSKIGELTQHAAELEGKVLSLVIPAEMSFAERESFDRAASTS
ncbi:MAG: diphthine synthase [Candidatus Marsarchaeota archaeon]|nr:diphthine synthase [Candidatus Marsarchaeota archaeon]